MDNRERAMNILHYRDADRLPAVHFGYWPELLVEWAEQGHLDMALAKGWRDGNDADREIDRLIGWDFNWGGAESPNNRLFPPFEYKVLEELPKEEYSVVKCQLTNHDSTAPYLYLVEKVK